MLGLLEVVLDGRAIELRAAKVRSLLGMLLISPNQVVAADQLAEGLWGDDPPASAVNTLQGYMSQLRKALGGSRIQTRSPGYVLTVDENRIDAVQFERLLDEGRRARASEDPNRSVALLAEALELWRGEALADFTFAEWAQAEIARLRELRLVATEEWIEGRLDLGEHSEVLAELDALVTAHPLRERLWAARILALYRSGRPVDALRAFEVYRRLLAEELGLDPSPELRAIEVRVLRHDPELAHRRPVSGTSAPVVVTPVTSFVGRKPQIADVIRCLSEARLVTLTGAGGVGKTRLALHVALSLTPQFPDGVVVCELAAIADPDAVGPAIATALGIQPRSDRSVEGSIADVLRTRQMLLVVDNCEHVVDAAAFLLSTLVRHCPQVRIMATSRERLAIDGEQVWPLAPLEPEEAVELFCDRIRTVRPELDCSGTERDAIVDICRQLDGLPLAIELAAARVAAIDPGDLVRRLDDRFRLLDRGSRSSPGRHRSLRTVVDWSYERLGEGQRRVFDRLSVFAGSFTLDAAEAICAGDGTRSGEIPALVAELVDASLLTLISGPDRSRYRLLETLRSYGRDRLEENGSAAHFQGRHADYYLELARQGDDGIRGSEEGRWMRRLDAELDNLRAGHRWVLVNHDVERALALSAALHGYAHRAMRPEVFTWAEHAARMPGAAGHRLLPLALASAATGAWTRGDLAGARQLAEEAVEASAGSPEGHLAYEALGTTTLFSGDPMQARLHIRRAAELAQAFGDPYGVLVNRASEILVLAYDGQAAEVIDEAEGILAAAREVGCPSATAWGLYMFGEVLLDRDPPRALALLDESHALATSVGSAFLTGIAGTSATTLRARHGDPETALRAFPALIDHWQRAGNWTQQWTMLRSLVTTLARLGRDESAAVLYGAMNASPTAPPVFGDDAKRLADVLTQIEERAGRRQLAHWLQRGRQLGDENVVAFARAAASTPPG